MKQSVPLLSIIDQYVMNVTRGKQLSRNMQRSVNGTIVGRFITEESKM